MATKTTFVVFKQHDPQSVAVLIVVDGTPSLGQMIHFFVKKLRFLALLGSKSSHRNFCGGRNFCQNFCLPLVPELNFHLWRRFFSDFDKINNFRQQKQLLLFLSNMTPKVCCQKFSGLGTPSGPQEAFKLKKTPFLGALRLKMAPHRRFGGSKIPATLIFVGNN